MESAWRRLPGSGLAEGRDGSRFPVQAADLWPGRRLLRANCFWVDWDLEYAYHGLNYWYDKLMWMSTAAVQQYACRARDVRT